MANLILFVFLLLQTLLVLHTRQLTQGTAAYLNQNSAQNTRALAAAIERYYIENGAYPASLAALTTTPGYEYLKSAATTWGGYSTTTGLTDGIWIYSRAFVYSQDSGNMVPSATVLGAGGNACGTAAFATAQDWCSPTTLTWFRHETRDRIGADLIRERKRQRRTLTKLAKLYVTSGWQSSTSLHAFPDPGTSAATLANLVGYAGAANNCTGIFSWNGIPFDCTDLFSAWGTPTTYNYLGNTHVSLVASTSLTRADGTALHVSSELAL